MSVDLLIIGFVLITIWLFLIWNWWHEVIFYKKYKWDYSVNNPNVTAMDYTHAMRPMSNRMRMLFGYPFFVAAVSALIVANIYYQFVG